MASSLKSNLVYSVLGVFVQTLFPLIVYPYITRVLGVANLGEYNFYTSTVAYLALMSGFGVSLLGTKEIGKLKDSPQKYSQVFWELLTVNLIMCAIVYIVVIFLIFNSGSYQNIKLFLITSITLIGNAVGSEYLFVALEQQKFMLIRNVIFKLISLFLIFIFVKDECDLLIYAFIMMISTFSVSLTNIINYKNKIDWSLINFKKINLRIYIVPLFQVFIMDILIHYYGMMDIVILGNMDTSESVGYYSTASKIYALSYSFLASTAIPLLPRASYYINNGLKETFNSLIQRCYDIYLLFVLFVTFILFFYSHELITLLAGDAFANGDVPLKLFAFTLLFSSLCNCFIFQIFYPYNRTKHVLIALIASVFVNFILSLLLIPILSYIGAAIAFVVSYVVLFIFMLVFGKDILPKFTGWTDLLKECIAIFACFIFCHVFNVYFIVGILFCVFIYCALLFWMKNLIFMYLLDLAKNKIKSLLNQ